MSNWDPTPTGGQLSIITFTMDEIVAETSVSVEEMMEWHKLGWLSFSPCYGEQYQPYHPDEVNFMASLVRFGLSSPMIKRILRGLPKPYYYNPKLMVFSFCMQKWQQLPGLSEEDLRELYFQ